MICVSRTMYVLDVRNKMDVFNKTQTFCYKLNLSTSRICTNVMLKVTSICLGLKSFFAAVLKVMKNIL